MSLYSDYHKEQGLIHVIESDSGFISYYFVPPDECYIQDVYVVPEKRKTRLASELADQVAQHAKSHGCKYLTGSVIPQANNATRSIQVLVGYGMKLLRAESKIIYFVKDLI